MQEAQGIPPNWLQWAWTVGLALSVILTILALIRITSLIKRSIVFLWYSLKKVLTMLSEWLYGLRYSPKIKVTKEPVNIIMEPIYETTRVSCKTSIKLELKPRDKEEKTRVVIKKMRVVITQGYGRRKREIILERSTKNDERTILVLCPEDNSHYEEILFEGFRNIEQPCTNIDPNKQFRWRIDDIHVEMWGLHKKIKFSGHKK